MKNNKKGKWKFVDENDSDIEEDDDDEDDDDDDDNNDDDEIIETDTNECPRDCVCNRNMNGYMVATCNRYVLRQQQKLCRFSHNTQSLLFCFAGSMLASRNSRRASPIWR